MPTITLSSATQTAIKQAVAASGENNQDNLAALNDIYQDIQKAGGFNTGTLAWFSQAGLVNTELSNPTPVGSFIWGYFTAAAAAEGVTVTPNVIQQSSDTIDLSVFNRLTGNNFSFTDNPGAQTNFAPASIVQSDAGAGIAYVNQQTGGNLSYAAWGGTLFAQTELNDPTYLEDYNINTSPGSQACNVILAGAAGGAAAVGLDLLNNPGQAVAAFSGLSSIDTSILQSCAPNATGMLPPIPISYTETAQPTFGVGENGSVDFQESDSLGTQLQEYGTSGNNTTFTETDLSSVGVMLDQATYTVGSGDSTSSVISYNASGNVQYEESGAISSSGALSINVSGMNAVVGQDAGGASVSLAGDAQATFDAGNDFITGQSGDAVTDAGASNTFDGSSYGVTLGANNLTLEDGARGLTLADASGVAGGTVTLATSNLGATDDANELAFTDGSGVTGGTVALGADNLLTTDDAAGGLTFTDASGVTGNNTIAFGGSNAECRDTIPIAQRRAPLGRRHGEQVCRPHIAIPILLYFSNPNTFLGADVCHHPPPIAL